MTHTMTPKELAAQLNGRGYKREITRAEEAAAKAAGIVVVFGASDDLMEFRGAIYDEVGAWDGTTVRVDRKGLVPKFDELEHDQTALREYFKRENAGALIDALWCAENPYSWTYRTSIPHETFDVMEDGEPYCRGIVFALSDVPE